MPTLWEWYTSYFDLLIQIVFVVLGYGGQYISPINNQPTPVPEASAEEIGPPALPLEVARK